MGLCKHKPILPFLLRVSSLGRDRKSGKLTGKLMTTKRGPRRKAEAREIRRIMDAPLQRSRSLQGENLQSPALCGGTLGSLDK